MISFLASFFLRAGVAVTQGGSHVESVRGSVLLPRGQECSSVNLMRTNLSTTVLMWTAEQY